MVLYWILLVYNYRMPTEKELNAVKADKPAEFRFLIENDAFFFLSKFGSAQERQPA